MFCHCNCKKQLQLVNKNLALRDPSRIRNTVLCSIRRIFTGLIVPYQLVFNEAETDGALSAVLSKSRIRLALARQAHIRTLEQTDDRVSNSLAFIRLSLSRRMTRQIMSTFLDFPGSSLQPSLACIHTRDARYVQSSAKRLLPGCVTRGRKGVSSRNLRKSFFADLCTDVSEDRRFLGSIFDFPLSLY